MADDDLELKRELIKALDKAIAEGRWEGTLFLESAGKNLRQLRDTLYHGFHLDAQAGAGKTTATVDLNLQNESSVDIFVSLYQADGLNMTKWANILNSISSYGIGRSIYRNEDDMKAFLRAKENKPNDAYAVVSIRREEINNPGNPPLADRLGYELLVVQEGAIKTKNIRRFVHTSGEYIFVNGVLTKKV